MKLPTRLLGGVLLAIGVVPVLGVSRAGATPLALAMSPEVIAEVTEPASVSPAPGSTDLFEYDVSNFAEVGTKSWYLARLRLRVTLIEPVSVGKSYLTLNSSGAAGVSVVIETSEDGDGVTTSWNSLDYLNGGATNVVMGPTFELESTNLIQRLGVRDGSNPVAFAIEADRAVFASVEVLTGTAILRTGDSPQDLAIDVENPSKNAVVGQPMTVSVVVKNLDGEPSEAVRVSVQGDPDLEIGAISPAMVGRLTSTQVVSIPIRPMTAGQHSLVISARGSAYNDQAGARISFIAYEKEARDLPVVAFGGALVLGGGLMVTQGVRNRSKHRLSRSRV